MCRLRKTSDFATSSQFCFKFGTVIWYHWTAYMIFQIPFSILGWYDLLQKLAGVHKSQKNACKILHRLVEKTGVTLPLKLDAVLITIKRRRPFGQFQAWWPFFSMKAWVDCLLKQYPKTLLGGCFMHEGSIWQAMFFNFWAAYRSNNPTHPIYGASVDWRYTVPYCFHGDEGRGLARDPFLVLSWQPIIGFKGLGTCNDSSSLGRIRTLLLQFRPWYV